MTPPLQTAPPELVELAAPATDEAGDLAALAHPVPVLEGSTSCEALDRMFGRDAALDCVVVRHPTAEGVLGLLQRSSFEALMTGPFGYGRSLYARRRVGDIAQWDALLLSPATGLVEAAGRAVTRRAEHVHDHVLVVDGDRPLALPMPVLLGALARTLAARALTDPLTGLANRDLFFGRVEEACRRSATREGHVTAVVHAGLDGFKSVNDDLGHGGGDEVLVAVGRALADAARPPDVVARLGGDEFAVCVELEDGDGPSRGDRAALAAAVADRVHAAIGAVRPSGAGEASVLRASVGVAVCGPGTVTAPELVRAADLAMYTAKKLGGNQVARAVVVDSAAHADPLLGTSVTAAATAGELRLDYQPIVALDSGELVSLEALVRWRHPRLGALPPGAFLPAVERAGQLADLDDWVLRTACRDFAAWAGVVDRPGRPCLNVNVSTAWLLRGTAVATAVDAAAAAGLHPARVRLEVSETLLADQLEAVGPTLRRLAEHGLSVTFDDVGAGSTSLRHLRDVQADGLKIDRSYVQGMATSERDRAVVQLLVDFGIGTGARVTAEGIETEEQRERLLSMGCELGQGWLFGRPVPLAELGSSRPPGVPASRDRATAVHVGTAR